MNYKTYLGKRGYVLLKKYFSDKLINEIKNELTVKPFVNDDYGLPPEEFKVYAENSSKLYIPKFYGIEKIGKPDINRTPHGQNVVFDFKGELRQNQIEPVEVALKECREKGGGILALPCASGKTCIALYLLSVLGQKSLIIVHKEFLLNQWKERIEQFLPDAKIGVIQQNKVDIEDKDIVIAMLQSISMKEYALNTFDSMNTVIVDECFVGDTEVITNYGNMKIKELYNMFDNNLRLPLIMSYNHRMNTFELKRMTYSWKRQYDGELYEIVLNNGVKVICTPNHKILTPNGYKKISKMDIGNEIISNCFGDVKISYITLLKTYEHKCFVYDIEVENNHNFLVTNNNIKNGIVVHNCHHISSKVFSRALRKINSQYMIGLSATPNRKDGLTKVFKWYIGNIIYERKHKDTNIVEVERLMIKSNNSYYNKECMNYKMRPMMPKMVNNICENLNRTRIIVHWIKELLEEDRKILVLSDRRAHLEDINKLLYQSNVKSVGFYVGGMKQKDLDISATKMVILGTYAIAQEGLDIPGIDTEILSSPKSDIVQAVGRILRKKHEERPAKIIDVVDNFSIFTSQALKRLKLYTTRNYEIEDITVWDELDNNGLPVIDKRFKRDSNKKNSIKNSTKNSTNHNDENNVQAFLAQFKTKSMFSSVS